MTTPAYGFAAQLGVDTVSPVTKRFDFDSENLVLSEDFKDTNGLRGTRARSVERIRQGNRHVGGSIKFMPTAAELALLLPWITGGVPSGGPAVTYPLAEALSSRFVAVDRVQKVFTINGCVVDRCTIDGRQGEPLEVTLDVVGIDETIGAAGSFPVLALDETNSPFMFSDLVLSINAASTQAKSVQIVLDNSIDKDRFFNVQTATALIAMDRHVTLNTSLPYGDSSALYGLGPTGSAVTATFSNGGAVFTVTFPKVDVPPTFPGYRREAGGDACDGGICLEERCQPGMHPHVEPRAVRARCCFRARNKSASL